jgi:hypothetical protein
LKRFFFEKKVTAQVARSGQGKRQEGLLFWKKRSKKLFVGLASARLDRLSRLCQPHGRRFPLHLPAPTWAVTKKAARNFCDPG